MAVRRESLDQRGSEFRGIGITRFLAIALFILFILSMISAILPREMAGRYKDAYMLITASFAAFLSIYIYYHADETSRFRRMMFHLSLALFLWWSAELLWIYYTDVLNIAPYPSMADLFWLAGYVPLFYITIYTLSPYLRYIGIKSLGLVILPLSGVIYFVFIPLLHENVKLGISPVGALFNLTYVLIDVGVLILVTFLAVIYQKKKLRYYWLFIAGFMGLVLAGDIIQANLRFQNLYYPGSLPDALQTLAYSVFALGMYVMYRREMDFRTIEELEERLLENIINSSPDSIITTDKEGKITLYNRDGSNIYGYTPREAIGAPFTSLFPENSMDEVADKLDSVFKGAAVANFRTKARAKDGRLVDVSLSLSQLRDGEGNLLGVVGISKDITQEVKAEKEIRKAYEEMKALNEMKKSIVANVSHELRTPLMIAKSSMELATELKTKKERDRFLKMGITAMTKQNSIIENLLKAATIDKAELNLKSETLNLKNAVDSVVREVTPEADKKEVKIEVAVEDDISRVKGDQENLSNVLRNLLSNAIKFNKEGGRIRVEAVKNGREVEVLVGDTGIGIARQHWNKIFERFYQVEAGLARKYGGTGMGLAICKDIVEAQGGRIWVRSVKGKGSTFHFTIPLVKHD
jgi:PAS domain S-box-containing protein